MGELVYERFDFFECFRELTTYKVISLVEFLQCGSIFLRKFARMHDSTLGSNGNLPGMSILIVTNHSYLLSKTTLSVFLSCDRVDLNFGDIDCE